MQILAPLISLIPEFSGKKKKEQMLKITSMFVCTTVDKNRPRRWQ